MILLMKIVKQIEEQISYYDPTYSEQFEELKKGLDIAWEFYDKIHLENNIPPGKELYLPGRMLDLSIAYFQEDLMELEEQLVDFPEDPFELAEEMIQQEEFY